MRILGLVFLAALIPVIAFAAQININTANSAQLDTLPGIGPAKAAAIIDYRTKNGPFRTIEDIQKVSGIGPVTFSNMQSSITVGQTSAPQEEPTSTSQPSPVVTSYKKVQTVEPITNPKPSVNTHEQINAPAAVTEITVAGATLPPQEPTASAATGLFHSVWTFGLLGVILVAGGAFIFI
jgi:competence protein ComEA